MVTGTDAYIVLNYYDFTSCYSVERGGKLKLIGETKVNCIGRVRGRIQRSMAELLYNWDVHEVDKLSEELVDIVLSFAPSSLPDYSI